MSSQIGITVWNKNRHEP